MKHRKSGRNGFGHIDHAGHVVIRLLKDNFKGKTTFGEFRFWANSIIGFEEIYELDLGTVSLWATPIGSKNDLERNQKRKLLHEMGLKITLAERSKGETAKDSIFEVINS